MGDFLLYLQRENVSATLHSKKKGDIMTKLKEIYRCPVCGNMVEVLNAGAGELVCCGKPMIQRVVVLGD